MVKWPRKGFYRNTVDGQSQVGEEVREENSQEEAKQAKQAKARANQRSKPREAFFVSVQPGEPSPC